MRRSKEGGLREETRGDQQMDTVYEFIGKRSWEKLSAAKVRKF